MIKFCSGRLEGLVTSGTKIQITYIYMDKRPIYMDKISIFFKSF